MADNDEYVKVLTDTLNKRADWLDKSELVKLKDELRAYHTGFASLYNLYLKKGLIHEDPYKAEARIVELEVPSSASFSDAEKLDQLTRRLANYDNQLDFLVNFYQFSAEFLNLNRIKLIVGLVKYVDWVHLSPDSASPITKAVAEMTNQVKTGADALTMSVISESLSNLNRTYNPIMAYLKILTDYQREAYKLDVREMAAGMSSTEASNALQIKRKFLQVKKGTPFYPDLVEEYIREDFSSEGPKLKEEVLKKLKIEESKPKVEKAPVSFKSILVEGIQVLGGTSGSITEIISKIDENHTLLENTKKGFVETIKKLILHILSKEPSPVIYDVEYMDPVKGIPVRERVNYVNFRSDLDRKVKTLAPMATRGSVTAKLEAMQEEQLIGFLERNIKELQALHKTLSALDEFFKASVGREDREKIRGIKPELSAIKNAVIRANSKRHEYSAQKEEEEQLRRLGVAPQA